jgi:hypothetical protein
MILKSELKQVPVEQRVPGRIYGVADRLDGYLDRIVCHKEGNNDNEDIHWELWFALPESMLPVRELPDEFELKHGEWEYYSKYHEEWRHISALTGFESVTFRRKKATINPSLTIPSGTKSEQIAELEKILAELKQS